MNYLNRLSNDRMLDWSELKVFTGDMLNVTKNLLFEIGRKLCGKRRKCWLPAFSPFPTNVSKPFSVELLNPGTVS